MINIINLLYEIISIAMLEFITFFYLNKLFKAKKHGLVQILIMVLFVPMIWVLGQLIHSEIMMGIIQVGLLFVLTCQCFYCKKMQAVLFLVIEQFVFIACASLGSLLMLITGYEVLLEDKIVEEMIAYQAVIFLVLYTLVFAAMHIICMVWKKSWTETPISQTLLLCGSGIVSTICLIVNAQLVKEAGFKTGEVILSSLLPITLFAFYILYFSFSDKYYRIRAVTEHERITREYASKSTEYYEKLEQQQQEIRKLKHDMKNHLMVLSCMKEGGQEKEYVDKLVNEIEQKNIYEDSNNGIADIIFYEKQKEALRKEIQLEVSVEKGILSPYDDVELCTILTNAIDNGIEACEQLKTDRRLMIKGVKTSFGILVTFENRRASEIKKVGEQLRTTKTDVKNHGYGLNNIRQAVERLQGSTDINLEQERFRLSIMLPLGTDF